MVGKLTTHVLDTARGCPAAQMDIELWSIEKSAGERTLIKTTQTNHDGRTNLPLLAEEELKVGIYELFFYVGDYFSRHFEAIPNPPFLDCIPIRFGVADPKAHYHVPLLASPWSYSTYRGS